MNKNTCKILFGLTTVCAMGLWLTAGTPALAQGTANGWVTQHTLDPGNPPEVLIGSAANPIPIDLDPNGPPWTKEIFGQPGVTIQAGQVISLHETIVNAGKETWTDWHEHVLGDPTGVGFPGVWVDVRAAVNGVPTTFGLGGLGTPTVWLDPIDTPVQPGDIFEVFKLFQFDVPVNANPDVPLLTIQEYPTPEPASATLIGLSGLAFLARRRKRAASA